MLPQVTYLDGFDQEDNEAPDSDADDDGETGNAASLTDQSVASLAGTPFGIVSVWRAKCE